MLVTDGQTYIVIA